MRAASRIRVLVVVGALAVPGLAGTGCEAPPAWKPPDPAVVARRPPREGPPATVRLLAPRPLDDGPAAPQDSGPAPPEVAPVVWRASSRGVTVNPLDDDPGPVLPVSAPHGHGAPVPAENDLPRELDKVTMPPYRIEPPDVLIINACRVIPRPPYRIEPLDELTIQAPPAQVLPNEPIGGAYAAGPDGQVDLGYSYGKVTVAGLTPEQARAAIAKHVAELHGIKAPAVSVALRQTRGLEQIRGEHLVRMDGTVSLGVYGDAYVAGLTLAEARAAIETLLSGMLLSPRVTVDVAAYNSKVYYVIYDGGGRGQEVIKLPLMGGETVLDAISALHGLPAASSTKRIWIARPVPGHVGCRQVLPVDWAAITEGGATNTNYQLFPGDRVYVKADHWVALENKVSKALAPFQRLFGVTLLGDVTVRRAD
jgi:polysaccharide export outer membrane protein